MNVERPDPTEGTVRMARILVVDDDDTVGEVVATYLNAAGMEVARCADGAQAVAAFEEGE